MLSVNARTYQLQTLRAFTAQSPDLLGALVPTMAISGIVAGEAHATQHQTAYTQFDKVRAELALNTVFLSSAFTAI